MRFIDEVKIEVKAGNGGGGAVSFRREKFIPKGGPDGGDGGRGGHVILQASLDKNTLQELYLRKRVFAENGRKGMGSNCNGRSGQDVLLTVPVGTVIKDEEGCVIADLTQNGQEVVLARGGRGGLGNSKFATSTNRTPRYAQPGEEGEGGIRFLELKSMADVGLVGLPNAGKSTFISRVSNAKPKVADYPFTTIKPSLGQVFTDDGDGFVVADIPGIIEGAHEGKGLGIRFLKHIERTTILLHLVDSMDVEGRTVTEQVHEVERELTGYGDSLTGKVRFLVLNKIDGLDEEERQSLMQEATALSDKVYAISAVTGEGVPELLHDLHDVVRQARQARLDELAAQGGDEEE